MDVRELRRQQVRREAAAYLSIPVFYLAFMISGVFLFVPEYVVLNFFLILFVLLQLRSGRIAASIAERTTRPSKPRSASHAPAVAQADKCFLAQVNFQSVANIASFLAFLAAIDLWLRTNAAASSGGSALAAGAVVALAIYFAGHGAARSLAWRAFAREHADLWNDPAGFDRGKAVRSTGQYFDWRLSMERGG